MKKLYILFYLIFCFLSVACTNQSPSERADVSPPQGNEKVSDNERLGTTWGDELRSQVTSVKAKRTSNEPVANTQLRYADKSFTGKALNSMSLAAGKVSFSVIDDENETLPLYRQTQKYYLKAKSGQSYQLKFQNHTNQVYEVVTSVDGLDVINGSEASKSNSGYLLSPYSTLVIEGFRKSNNAVASFTFGKPEDAYAANSSQGSIDNTGIIGVAIFEVSLQEKQITKTSSPTENTKYSPAPQAFPADK